MRRLGVVTVAGVLGAGVLVGHGCGAQTAGGAMGNSSRIEADGTAVVTRVVPVPKTVSPEAQRMLGRLASDAAAPETLEMRRVHTDEWQNRTGEAFRRMYPATVMPRTMAGVPTRVVTPGTVAEAKKGRVLINLHGGGFDSDSGSLTESIPVASLTGTTVIAVLYRLAPEHPFPAGLDDAVAVYREVLKTHRAKDIGIFGTSAGAILTGEAAVRIRDLGLPLPGALGIFSGMGDFSKSGDSIAMYALNGLSGHLDVPRADGTGNGTYVGKTAVNDPTLSIVSADLRGMPPTLFLTSGRDLLLSGTTILHRAFLRAGDEAQLVVFEGLPHAFWNDPSLPETREAHELMARFFDARLGR